MLSTVTTKGQVTIPKKIRDALQIKPSDRVDFMQKGGIITIIPVRTLKEFRGVVQKMGVGGFEKERKKAKSSVGRRVIEEMQ